MKASWMHGVLLGCLASCGAVQDVHHEGEGSRPAGTVSRDGDDEGDEGDDDEQEIALDQVPAAVRKAAEAAVPGFVLASAETETEEGALHYCLEGTAGGEAVEIEVTTDARVLEIERGEDDDDE